MVRLHDMRDWAQRQKECHDLHAHRAPPPRDAWWQMHCRLDLLHPPCFVLERRLQEDRFVNFLERTWMVQQLPWALLFLSLGGLPWLILGRAGSRRGQRDGALASGSHHAPAWPTGLER
jgi:stearoyl-CoA desaturase (delta-9 desaturase)